MELLVWFFLLGSLAGLLAGLLGVGGGLVVVPGLLWLFQQHQIAPGITMHVAVGTSLAIIILAGGMSARTAALGWPDKLMLALEGVSSDKDRRAVIQAEADQFLRLLSDVGSAG